MRKLSLLALVLATAACRDSGGGDDTQNPDSNTSGSDTKIQAIQDEAMTNGTAVTVKGVIVTAIDAYGGKTGDFWIQEPEGGEFSGIHVFGAPLDQVAALAIGDVVDVSGAEKDDFMYSEFDPGYAITELKPVSGGVMTVTKTGANMVLEPQVVNAAEIGALSDYMARHAEWEKWEGVLIKIENVRATSSDACVGSMCTDATLHKFEVTGDVVIQSSLAAMPTPAVMQADCLASITGVLDYFFDYQLLPRTTAEIVAGGTGCEAISSATIADVRSGAATGTVEINDVYVSAVSFNKKNFWISQSLTAAPNQGAMVFRCAGSACNNTAVLDASVVVGAKVKVIASVAEFNNGNAANGSITQLRSPVTTVLAAPTTAPVPVTGQSVTSLLATTGEPYEGVLVTLSDVKVTTVGTNGTFGVSDLAAYPGAVAFKADDDMYRFVAGDADDCYASITGIWTYTPFEMRYQFLPTDVGTGTGTCN